jgi:Mn-dependent DtxR family transcriptional regulator
MNKKKKPNERGLQLMRLMRLIFLLSGRAYRLSEIADHFKVSPKTVRRDLHILESVDLPIYTERAQLEDCRFVLLWRIDPRWISKR